MKKVSNQSAQSLLDEQRSWVKFKDSACTFYNSGDFGREGQMLRYGECKASIVAQRVKALTGLATDLKERTSE
jgi:uncharacterized protein YecT (DUF1311 family)